MKYQLWDMSWKEAEEAFKKSDMAIVPVGTLHGHGPTPVSIDSSSVGKLAEEVGKRTGVLTLPLLPYGENDKMKYYPGSIAIDPEVLEDVYTDICGSLYRNGIRRVIFLNGHGGNRESLIRTGRNVRDLGMIIAILEWWSIGRKLAPELYQESRGCFIEELAVSIAIGGKNIADLRGGGYKGEWGENPTRKKILGEKIKPLGFNDFEYKDAQIIVPVEAWDLDVESPPEVDRNTLDELHKRGEAIISRVADYVAEFAKDFQKIDISTALKSKESPNMR